MRNFHKQLTLQLAILCLSGMYAIAQSEGDPPNLPPPLESPSQEDPVVSIPPAPEEPETPEIAPPKIPSPEAAPTKPQEQPVAPPVPSAPELTEPTAKGSSAKQPVSPPSNAEIAPNESFDAVAGDSSPAIEATSKRLLNEDTPEWVKKGLLLGDEHSLAISSSLFPTIEQCREDLKARMMNEVYSYLDQHVLDNPRAQMLSELNRDYVEKFWVNQKQVFDNVHEREGVTYHQLWIGLHISAEQLKKVREWEKTSVRTLRTKSVGVMSGVGIGAITLLSGLVGLMARREKAKLKT